MPQVFNIAPRVLVYSHGTVPPAVEEGWLTLPQLPTATTPTSAGAATSVRSMVAPVHDGAPGAQEGTPLRPSPASDMAVGSLRGAPVSLGAAPPSRSLASPATGVAAALGPTPLTHVVFGDGSHPTTRL